MKNLAKRMKQKRVKDIIFHFMLPALGRVRSWKIILEMCGFCEILNTVKDKTLSDESEGRNEYPNTVFARPTPVTREKNEFGNPSANNKWANYFIYTAIHFFRLYPATKV